MKKNAVLVVSAALLLTMVLANTLLAEHEHKGKPLNAEIMQKTQKLQMPFVANEGQLDERVAFYARTFGGTVFVTKDGDIVYSLPGVAHAPPLVHNEINKGKTEYTGLTGHVGEEGTCIVHHALCTIFPFCTGNFPVHYAETNSLMCHTDSPVCHSESNFPLCHSERSEASHGNNSPSTRRDTALRIPATQSTAVALKEEFIGAKISGVKGEGESVTKVSYFKGNDPSKWKSNIFTYELVNLGEIYDGVELKLKAHGNNVEKLLYVKPGADPSQIKIRLSGVQSSENPPPTPASGGQSSVPLAEGDKGGGSAENPQNQYRIGAVQKSRHHVIAKEERLKQSPDSHSNAGIDCFANARNDRENQPFLTDSQRGLPTKSPLTKGARGLWVNDHGELVAETELGPVKFTKPVAYQMIDGKRVEVDCKYVMRGREEKDTPLRAGSGFQPEPLNLLNTGVCAVDTISKGLNNGVQVANLNPQEGITHPLPLSRGEYKSPLRGGDSGVGKSAIQGPKSTNSNSKNPKSKIANRKSEYGFTVASYDRTKELIIDPLLASTYLGGSGHDIYFNYGNCFALDTSGNVYVTMMTSSTDFPTTSGAYDTSYNGGIGDVVISKLNSGLTSLLASTYLGGHGNDNGYSLVLDTSGNVYVTGLTSSTDFPTTNGAYDTSYNGNYDVFVSKLDSGLTSLLASTYLGESGGDTGYSLTLDTSGNVYVTGHTYSSNFPATSGAYDTSYNGNYDVFVSKLDSGLTSLLASTYLGGSGNDTGYSLTLDTSGSVYVTGHTYSSNFPTSGSYDTSYNGDYDVSVSKLDSGLTSLLASTYLGGSGNDTGYSLTLDTSGSVYVTGHTYSSNFPTTSGAYDTSYNGNYDVFVSKLNSGLTSLLASTYLGGSGGDEGYSLTLDTSGNVYVTGETGSSDFPTTSGAYDTSYNGGDVFVSKLNSGLTNLLASTYLGGSGDDEGYSLTLDTSGNVYVTGETGSSDFPTTSGAYDTSYNGGGYGDVFVSKLDGNLSDSSRVGLFDHFSFSTISSPQTVGVPFGVTIMAKDTYGNTVTGLNGEVTLWSSAGAVSPANHIHISNGQWKGNVTLYEAGSGTHLGVSGDGKSGTSNSFDVPGQGSGLGRISGGVMDNRGEIIVDARVVLEDRGELNAFGGLSLNALHGIVITPWTSDFWHVPLIIFLVKLGHPDSCINDCFIDQKLSSTY